MEYHILVGKLQTPDNTNKPLTPSHTSLTLRDEGSTRLREVERVHSKESVRENVFNIQSSEVLCQLLQRVITMEGITGSLGKYKHIMCTYNTVSVLTSAKCMSE